MNRARTALRTALVGAAALAGLTVVGLPATLLTPAPAQAAAPAGTHCYFVGKAYNVGDEIDVDGVWMLCTSRGWVRED
ncbi:hypothetical protein AB0M43_13560 [Longispora sp. NPDC051575]|uniref:hypothetical protein n=1 Tax=Longispora sp. NPDC051575 TaxID=3154943 RepID=UPI00343DA980